MSKKQLNEDYAKPRETSQESAFGKAGAAVADSLPGRLGIETTKFVGSIVGQALTSETFFNWLAHGSTELANMVLHGHAAPVYSHSASPAATAHGPTLDVQPMQETQTATPNGASIIGKYLPEASSLAQSTAIGQATSHGISQPQPEGIVDQCMQDVLTIPDPRQPEQQISR